MKIAIITSGLLPLPAVKGGAIETLIDSFSKENESQKKFAIDIYSLSSNKAKKIAEKQNYKLCNYIYISQFSSLCLRIINKILKKNISINKYYQKKVVNMINKKSYDYVIVENYPELVLAIKNNKVVPYIHSDVFNKEIKNGKEIINSCHKIIVVSNFIKNRILEIDKNAQNKIFIVYNSIDFKTFNQNEIKKYRKEFRTKYNIKENDFVYAFSGRLSKEKGPLQLIQAFNQINVLNKKLLIIGGVWYDSKKSNNYYEQLKAISNDSIIFTGYINHSDIDKVLCSIDVGVVPSICNEAAGLSVVEFMNIGALVVASNKGGIKEYLNIDDNYLVEYKNEEDFVVRLAKSLEKCYKSYNDEKKINNINYSKKFSVKENYNQIVNILK